MKIAIVDTYYPEALKAMPLGNGTYQQELDKVLARQFGTADFYSRELRKLGWEAIDIIANHFQLQARWARANMPKVGTDLVMFGNAFYTSNKIVNAQIKQLKTDVVFLQDLSIHIERGDYLVAGQCSCPWPGDDKIRACHIVFTSFPHYIHRIESLGVNAVYMPLAFSPSVLDETVPSGTMNGDVIGDIFRRKPEVVRDLDCTFVGGVGNPSHWKRGLETLQVIAESLGFQFKWWGYGVETFSAVNSTLRLAYQGQAWGRDMYDILLRSKIVINRHGEVVEGFANNLRMYEATGCGALLLTDNQTDLFSENEIVRYSSPEDAVMKIRYYLEHESERAAIAARGQLRTLRDHTYRNRVPKIAEVLIAFKAGNGAGYSTEVARNFWKEPSFHYGR